MQTLAKTPQPQSSNDRSNSVKVAESSTSLPFHRMMALQQTLGNAGVGQLLRLAMAEARSHSDKAADGTTSSAPETDDNPPVQRSTPGVGVSGSVVNGGTGPSPDSQGTAGASDASAEVSLGRSGKMPGLGPALEGPESRFSAFSRLSASDIASSIGSLGNESQLEFDDLRTTTAEQAPVIRAKLPGDAAKAPQATPPQQVALPSADGISVPASSSSDGLSAEETSVPNQPDGDGVSTAAGPAPKIRLAEDADPAHLATAADQSRGIGLQVRDQVSSEIASVAAAAWIQRTGVDREEQISIAASSAAPTAQASPEMLDYVQTEVPPSVRAIADADFAPLLEQSLAGPRQQVQQALSQRDADRDLAFAAAQQDMELATKQANEEQQRAISDGYAQVEAEKQKGLDEGRETLATFDTEVKQRHATQDAQIREKVTSEQQKADDAIAKGEEQARKAEQDAQAEKKRQEDEAERNKPEEKKNWLGQVVDAIADELNRWKDALVNAVKQVFDTAKKLVSDALTAAKNLAVGIIRGVKSFVVSAIQSFATGLKVLVNQLLVAFPKLKAKVNAAIDGAVSVAVKTVEMVASKLEETVTAVVDRAESTLNRVLDVCELVIVTQIEVIGALLTGNFLDAAKILFLAACKAVGIPGEEFLQILADANDALLDIIKRPSAFLGYLLKAVGQGMQSFFLHFPQRMVAGLTGWLFGQVAEGGVSMPKSFELKSIFMLLLQVMGFTYEYVKTKVIQLVGEKAVSVIEQVLTPIRILFTEGPGALWHWLADQADQVKTAIVEAASQWLVTKIITEAAVKLATMFTPVGAFVQAVLMMYNTIMFFVEKIKEIFAWVHSITSSLKTIAVGAISAAADFIDQSMSKSIPLIIAFLAKLLGVDGIGQKIRDVVSKLRTPVDKAITFVVENLIKMAKAAWSGIKTGATAVKERIVNWWDHVETFNTRDGESHRLFFETIDGKSRLMVASDDPKDVEQMASEDRSLQGEKIADNAKYLNNITKDDPKAPEQVNLTAKQVAEDLSQRQTIGKSEKGQNAALAVTRYPTATGAFAEIQFLPVIESTLPRVESSPTSDRHIYAGVYRIAPQLINSGDPHVVYYVAYNQQDGGRAEYAIGPEQLDTFIGGVYGFMIAGGNFFGFVGNPSKYVVTASQVGYLAIHGDLRGAVHALGQSWMEALQDPGWWTLAIATTASIVERGTLSEKTPTTEKAPNPTTTTVENVAPSTPLAIDPSQRSLITSHPEAHAFERHGGGITDAQLETRARTGVAPDGSSKVVAGKTKIPHHSTAFHSDELLVKADQAIRNGPLQAKIAADPSATVLRVEGFDVGTDLGRGYSRIGSGTYKPGTQGPLVPREGITKATAVYEKNATTGKWETITIYPEP